MQRKASFAVMSALAAATAATPASANYHTMIIPTLAKVEAIMGQMHIDGEMAAQLIEIQAMMDICRASPEPTPEHLQLARAIRGKLNGLIDALQAHGVQGLESQTAALESATVELN
jgi:hypothetical protein